jgi:hypothetical protein
MRIGWGESVLKGKVRKVARAGVIRSPKSVPFGCKLEMEKEGGLLYAG